MYVPGNDERKIGKIPQLGADCICLDCEDGVALNMKVGKLQIYFFLSCHIIFRIFHQFELLFETVPVLNIFTLFNRNTAWCFFLHLKNHLLVSPAVDFKRRGAVPQCQSRRGSNPEISPAHYQLSCTVPLPSTVRYLFSFKMICVYSCTTECHFLHKFRLRRNTFFTLKNGFSVGGRSRKYPGYPGNGSGGLWTQRVYCQASF
jgi:hypothetical protein